MAAATQSQNSQTIIQWRKHRNQRRSVRNPHAPSSTPHADVCAAEISERSRAARRAVSPSIDLDKSITEAKLPESPKSASKRDAKPHVLAAQDGGIRKSKSPKFTKRQQRLRHLKGLERGAAVLDKRDIKVQKSVMKEKVVKERSKGWEDINGESKKKEKKSKNAFAALEEDDGLTNDKEREWVSDEDMDAGAGADEVPEPEISGEVKNVEVAASVPLPIPEDEML